MNSYIERYKAGENITWGRRPPSWVVGKDGYLAERDGYLCHQCGIDSSLQIYYLDGIRENTQPNNIKLICESCNDQPAWWNGKSKNASMVE